MVLTVLVLGVGKGSCMALVWLLVRGGDVALALWKKLDGAGAGEMALG